MKIISSNTFKLIEAKLHNRKQIQEEIDLWEQETLLSSGSQRENIHNTGYISDPTANKALKLDNPPPDIKEAIAWIEIINKTIEYAKKHNSYKVYFMWYELERRKTVTSAYTRLGMPERTFRIKRQSIVNYAGVKALEKGLIKNLYENF